jgi:hypothetical protein
MNKLKQLEKMKAFMESKGVLNVDFNFGCYSDQMFTYDIDEPFHIEVTFICDKFETLFSEMSFIDLLNLKKLEYFDFNCRSFDTDITYNSLQESNLN